MLMSTVLFWANGRRAYLDAQSSVIMSALTSKLRRS